MFNLHVLKVWIKYNKYTGNVTHHLTTANHFKITTACMHEIFTVFYLVCFIHHLE